MIEGSFPSNSSYSSLSWETLPSRDYFDLERYHQEVEQIWYQKWLYVCRADTIKSAGAYRTFEIGSQNIIVLRDETGQLQAFHNTCRHRGSILCTESEGQITSRRIVCPYHQWSYSFQGNLKGIPFIGTSQDYFPTTLTLYRVALQEWNGCVFINLADAPQPFEEAWDPGMNALSNWPLSDLIVGHTFTKIIQCNWKVFWENFEECYHCPGIHPELCDLVPIYKRAVTNTEEVLKLSPQAQQMPLGIRQGAETWSMDGHIHGVRFGQLTDEEISIGAKFLTALPGVFLIAHPDYVRIVSIYPRGPESIQLTAEWLFPAETLNLPSFDLQNVTKFATLVMEQDSEVCELNQRGLHSMRHKHGILVPHEYDVHVFQQWVRGEMKET